MGNCKALCVSRKRKKIKFEVIYLNVVCYTQYVDCFKTIFPYTAYPTYRRISNKYGYANRQRQLSLSVSRVFWQHAKHDL